jgi:hypothetical protein
MDQRDRPIVAKWWQNGLHLEARTEVGRRALETLAVLLGSDALDVADFHERVPARPIVTIDTGDEQTIIGIDQVLQNVPNS